MLQNIKYLSLIGMSMLLSSCLGVRITNSANNKTKEYKVNSAFHGIETAATADVEYIESDSVKVEIKAPDGAFDLVTVEVKDGVLVISQKDVNRSNHSNFDKYTVKAKVSAPGIDYLSTTGTGDIKAQFVTGDKIELLTYGTGDIDIQILQCDEVTFNSYGTGDIEILNLSANNAITETSGTGDIEIKEISATDLKATTSGTGDITIKTGNIGKAWFSVSGTGEIDARGTKINMPHTDNEERVRF